MATTRNEQLVIDFFEALGNNELEKVRKMFHKNATWTVMPRSIPGAGEHKGRDAIIDDFIAPIRGIFEVPRWRSRPSSARARWSWSRRWAGDA